MVIRRDAALPQHLAPPGGVGHLPGIFRDVLMAHIILDLGVVPLDGAAAGRVILRRGQRQGRVPADPEHGLDQSFSPGILTHEQSTVVVFDRPAHDLGGRGRAVMDDDDQGNIAVPAVLVRIKNLVVVLVSAPDGNDTGSLGQQVFTQFQRLQEGAAAVVAEIQDKLLHALALQKFHLRPELTARGLGEVPDVDVSDVVLQDKGVPDALQGNLRPFDGEFHGLVKPLAHNGDGDLGTLFPPQPLHSLIGGDGSGAFPVDLGNDVVGQDAQPVGGAALDGGYDFQELAVFLDQAADPEVLPSVILCQCG